MSQTLIRLLLATVLGGLLYCGAHLALRVTPAQSGLRATIEGRFTEGSGWHPGEPFRTARPVRAWGSWCDADENTGALTLGPFPAPAKLRFGVSGYPAKPGNRLYVENFATKARLPLEVRDVGERWHIVERALPREWRGEPITVHAIDAAQQNAGWLAITEPVHGGRGTTAAMLLLALTVLVPGALLLWRRPVESRAGFSPPLRAADATHTQGGLKPALLERALSWLLGACALFPLLWCARSFRELWWFGDEWDQLDQIARIGFWRWTVLPFGENVVPLFKSAWGGMALASGGSYWPMLAVVWLTHALNTALFARLLRSAGFGWAGASLAAAVFGLSVANAEILGWSIQWSNALAVLFLLLGLEWLLRHPPRVGGGNARLNLVLALCAAASALTFVRGVLTGIVLACGALLAAGTGASRPTRMRTASCCIAPSLAVVVWIFLTAPGNHRELGGEGLWLKAAEFALWFWAAVPLHRVLEVGAWDLQNTLVLGTLKLVLVVGGIVGTRGTLRRLLVMLLLFDLGNAALLGIGRHQSGLPFANSSRYYYNALICTLPFAAFAVDRALVMLRARVPRIAVATVVVPAAALLVARTWPHEAEMFAQWRGRNTRQILLHDPNPPAEGAVPGIPFLATERAKELIALYHLH